MRYAVASACRSSSSPCEFPSFRPKVRFLILDSLGGGAIETVHKLRGIVSTSILSKVLNGWAGDGPRDFDKSPIHA